MTRFFLILWLSFGGFARAQISSGSLTLSVNEGLSQGMVFDMIQSRDGYIWIATKDGLNRYDGYRFKIYSPDPFNPYSIATSEIWGLFEDSKGRIWVFYAGGTDVYVPESGRFYHVPQKLLEGFEFSPHYRTCKVAESSDGSIWVTENFRLWQIKLKGLMPAGVENKQSPEPDFEVKRITAISPKGGNALFSSVLFSGRGKLLVATLDGLMILDPSSFKLTPEGLQGKEVYLVGEDKQGHIFLSGIVPRTPEEAGNPEFFPGPDPRNWMVWGLEPGRAEPFFTTKAHGQYRLDQAGNLWINRGKGLTRWTIESINSGGSADFSWSASKEEASSPYFDFVMFFVDRSGIAWVGTYGFGVRKIVPLQPKFSSYLPLISQRRIFEDPDGLLICSEKPEWAFNTKTFNNPQPNPWYKNPEIFVSVFGAFVFDNNGNAWLSIPEGKLTCIDGNTGAVKSFPWGAYGPIINKEQVIYGVDSSGLWAFDTKTAQSKLYPFDKPQRLLASYWYLHFLFEGANGVIWIFGFEGLIKATPSAGGFSFTYYRNNPRDPFSLSNDFVCSVAEDPINPGSYLWVGTKGGGLNRLDIKTGKFTHYQAKEGLPDNVVYGVLAENAPQGQTNRGRLWMSTNKGLCRFDIGTGRFRNFTAADGLQSNEFNLSSYLKTRDGYMIFGGVKGLTVFHPDSLLFNPVMPQTHIVGVEVNNQPLESGGSSGLSLTYDQNYLNITFSALEFTNPEQNQYRYQLAKAALFGSNKDENWVELGGKNVVSLAGLSPGSYTFRVLGSNNDGLWSKIPAELQFVIRPPWWGTWWAFGFYLLILTGIIGFYFRIRSRQKIQLQETRRLKELDEFKSRFFTNISHEFRTPLTVILGTTEQISGMVPDEAIRQKTGLIKRSSQNLLRLINQLLDLARLESSTLTLNFVQGDVLPYLRYIAESLHSLANAQNVMLLVESPEKEIVMDYDPDRLLQIVYNLLSNAIKFTPSGGRVLLHVSLKDGWLQLSVADNGAGIPAADLPYIFDRFYQAKNLEKAKTGGTGIGLALTRELVHLLEGEVTVKSEPGTGTTFWVTLPVRRQALQQAPAKFESDVAPQSKTMPAAMPDTDLPTLLMVEDNPDVVEFLTASLKQAYHLEFAFNGRAGIEKAIEKIPDLVVSDVMMPEKDGFEVCATLKQDERTSHIPIVLLTAKAGVENRIAGLRHGADAYLGKPFHHEELMATLENLLELRRKLQARYRNENWAGGQQAINAPDLPPLAKPGPEDVFLQKVMDQLEKHLDDAELSIPELAGKLGLSQSQLYRKIKALTDLSTAAFIRRYRLQKGKQLLQTTGLTMAEIAYKVGFTTPNYFSDAFFEEFGMRPNAIRK